MVFRCSPYSISFILICVMAFCFKIAVDANPQFLPSDWLFSFELADVLVPITSFCFCFEGIFLVLMSMHQISIWSKAYHLKLVEILNDYYKLKHIPLIQRFSWIPFIPINAEMEFRIFHHIFCQVYHIQPTALSFDEYIERTLERYLLHIVEIRPVDWFLVIFCMFGNWAKNSVNVEFTICESGEEIPLEEYRTCVAWANIKFFTCLGAVIFLLSLSLAIVSRIYELRIIGSRGVKTGGDYIMYLKVKKEGIKHHMMLTSLTIISVDCLLRVANKMDRNVGKSCDTLTRSPLRFVSYDNHVIYLIAI